jgi:hypothetical protein
MKNEESSPGRLTPSSSESEESKQCAICGSQQQLHTDTHLEDVYYCSVCWEKAKRQQRAIDEGFEVEPEVEL